MSVRGWSNPNSTTNLPIITGISNNKSIITLTNIVAIIGNNFKPYSKIKFGNYFPDTLFVNSEHIDFYIPLVALPGQYTIQVFNGSSSSNVINYMIDNSVNFWSLDFINNKLTNNNNNDLLINGKTEIVGDTKLIGNLNFDSGIFKKYSINNVYKIKFNNETTQTTAYNALPAGTYNNATIEVNQNGQISSISNETNAIIDQYGIYTPATNYFGRDDGFAFNRTINDKYPIGYTFSTIIPQTITIIDYSSNITSDEQVPIGVWSVHAYWSVSVNTISNKTLYDASSSQRLCMNTNAPDYIRHPVTNDSYYMGTINPIPTGCELALLSVLYTTTIIVTKEVTPSFLCEFKCSSLGSPSFLPAKLFVTYTKIA